MYYIFANLAQLIWRMQSTRLVTSTTLRHNLGRQLILRERIFCKLVHPFEELSGQLVACRCEPSLRTRGTYKYPSTRTVLVPVLVPVLVVYRVYTVHTRYIRTAFPAFYCTSRLQYRLYL